MTKDWRERKEKLSELKKVLDCMEQGADASSAQGREEINRASNQILTSLDEFFSPLRELPPEQKRIAIVQREDLYYGFLQRYRFSEEEVPKEEFYEAMEQNVGVLTAFPPRPSSPPLVYSQGCGEILAGSELDAGLDLFFPGLRQNLRRIDEQGGEGERRRERENGPREEVQWKEQSGKAEKSRSQWPGEQFQNQDQEYKIHSIDGTIIIQDPQHNFYIAELKPLPGKGMLLQKRMEQKMSLGDLAAELKLRPKVLEFYLREAKDVKDYW